MDRLYSPSLSPPNQNIKKSVSPPMLMSFAPTHPNFKPIEITNPLVHLNRSRVIS
jgi:hypothetical protein